MDKDTTNLTSVFHEEPFTLFQTYGDNLFTIKNTFDYVFHSENLWLVQKIGPPLKEKLRDDGLLSQEFPSDHLSLYCTLSFKN